MAADALATRVVRTYVAMITTVLNWTVTVAHVGPCNFIGLGMILYIGVT